MSKCVLYNRECNNCGECNMCDLDKNKVCDNCMKCVLGEQNFISIKVDLDEKEQSK